MEKKGKKGGGEPRLDRLPLHRRKKKVRTRTFMFFISRVHRKIEKRGVLAHL